jgi:hypothetical protein
MKTIALFLITLFITKGCDAEAQQDLKNTVIEYRANTRGFYQKIIIKDQTIAISTTRDEKEMPPATKIADKDWRFLVSEFQKLKLVEMNGLKSPTEKRFYDGAAAADLIITHQGKIYKSCTFDNGYPPAEIEEFTNKITQLGTPKQE